MRERSLHIADRHIPRILSLDDVLSIAAHSGAAHARVAHIDRAPQRGHPNVDRPPNLGREPKILRPLEIKARPNRDVVRSPAERLAAVGLEPFEGKDRRSRKHGADQDQAGCGSHSVSAAGPEGGAASSFGATPAGDGTLPTARSIRALSSSSPIPVIAGVLRVGSEHTVRALGRKRDAVEAGERDEAPLGFAADLELALAHADHSKRLGELSIAAQEHDHVFVELELRRPRPPSSRAHRARRPA